jgi:regulator of protease activity HflC (stomatin/prohibitin superfamily)
MGIFPIISLVVLLLLIVVAIPFVFVRYTAVKYRKSEVSLLGGWIKFILWEPNEGIIILKNKLIKHKDQLGKGGTKFIFPIMGEELYARVPLTIRMLTWEDDRLLTRESLQIHMKVVIWWNVSDMEKFVFDIDESTHLNEKRKEIGSLSSSESWLLALTESTIRVLASRASATQLVTSVTARYLDVHHKEGQSSLENDAVQTISETIAHQLHGELNDKVNVYGININRIEIQAIRLSNEVQEAINKVWLSFLKPVQSEQESKARQIELEGVAKVLGTDTTSLIEIMKNMKTPDIYTQQQPFIQTVFNTIDSKAQGLQSKPDNQKHLPVTENSEKS